MASNDSHNTRPTADQQERRAPSPLQKAWNNSQDLVRTFGVSLLLHGALIGAAVAYVPPPVEPPVSLRTSSTTFEQVTIPADIYAAIVGESERAGDNEEAPQEPEAAQVETEPEIAAEPTPASQPDTEREPSAEPEEPTPAPEAVSRPVETEFESPLEPQPTEEIPTESSPTKSDDELVAAATPDDSEPSEASTVNSTDTATTNASSSSSRDSETGAATNASTTTSPNSAADATTGSGAIDRGMLNAHRLRLSRAMQGENQCPREAIRQRVNGIAYVGLTQDANGRVTHVSLKRSAGNDILDREAIAFAQGLRRLPAPPQDIQGTEFVVPVVFRCS